MSMFKTQCLGFKGFLPPAYHFSFVKKCRFYQKICQNVKIRQFSPFENEVLSAKNFAINCFQEISQTV